MTWGEIIEHLRAGFVVLKEEDGVVVIGWKVGASIHTQQIDQVEALGERWLRITSFAGWRSYYTADAVLEHNMTLTIGSLGARGDSVVIRHLTPLLPLTGPRLDQALELIAHEASRLRAQGGERTDPIALEHLASHFAE